MTRLIVAFMRPVVRGHGPFVKSRCPTAMRIGRLVDAMTLVSIMPTPLLLFALLGFAPTSQPAASGHEHKAPHGGALVELGEEFAHLEFVLDSAKGMLTAYVLDGEAEQAVRLSSPFVEVVMTPRPKGERVTLQLQAVASVLTGEKTGDSSQFAITSPALTRVTRFEGVVKTVTVRGREFKNVTFRYPEGTEH